MYISGKGLTHDDDAVTQLGLARVLLSMRHHDVEEFASLLEEIRGCGSRVKFKGRTLIKTAQIIIEH